MAKKTIGLLVRTETKPDVLIGYWPMIDGSFLPSSIHIRNEEMYIFRTEGGEVRVKKSTVPKEQQSKLKEQQYYNLKIPFFDPEYAEISPLKE